MHPALQQTRLIALDWGTSSLRAYRHGADGQTLELPALPRAVMQLPEAGGGAHAGFEEAFDQTVLVKGTVDWVDIFDIYLVTKPERIAHISHHRRSYAKADLVMNPLHYLALLEKKPRALEPSRRRQPWYMN